LPRARSGKVTHRRHKKVLELTKGHRAARHKLYRTAHESMLHALAYSYRHRRERKGDFRKLWITRINAAARAKGLTYSQFIAGLRKFQEFWQGITLLDNQCWNNSKTFIHKLSMN